MAVAFMGACSEDAKRERNDPEACPTEVDASGPPVGFTADLMPFFSRSCAFHGCHDGYTTMAGLYLGPNFLDGPPDGGIRSEVLASLLAASTTAPELYRVKPFDPRHSFLMLKVQGCQNSVGLDCPNGTVENPCGSQMPYVSPELTDEQKSLLATWIARGASGE